MTPVKCPRCTATMVREADGVYHCLSCGQEADPPGILSRRLAQADASEWVNVAIARLNKLLAEIATVNAVRDEAERIHKALTIFGADKIPELAWRARRPAAPRLGQRWAREFDACTQCGRTDRKHAAHGLCVSCLSLVRRNGHVEAPT